MCREIIKFKQYILDTITHLEENNFKIHAVAIFTILSKAKFNERNLNVAGKSINS